MSIWFIFSVVGQPLLLSGPLWGFSFHLAVILKLYHWFPAPLTPNWSCLVSHGTLFCSAPCSVLLNSFQRNCFLLPHEEKPIAIHQLGALYLFSGGLLLQQRAFNQHVEPLAKACICPSKHYSIFCVCIVGACINDTNYNWKFFLGRLPVPTWTALLHC